MPRSPLMVPEANQDTYLVLDDLGRLGRVWRETAEEDANHEALIRDLLDDQYSRPSASSPLTSPRAGPAT
jgi:hypothetical protein